MIANLINIGIFAFMMGFIEVFPNLLAVFFRSTNSSMAMNSTTVMALGGEGETSGEEIQVQQVGEGGEAWREDVADQAEAFDSTYEFSDYDYSWSRRRKRQVHEPLTDPLMEKFSGDNRRVGRTFLISPSLSSVIAPGEREAGDLPGGAESQHQPDQ